MKFRRWMMSASLIALLGAGSCAVSPGDFCDLYEVVLFDDSALALEVVHRDRAAAEAIATNHATWQRCPA